LKHTYRKRWGQNFLQDPNFIRKIIDIAQVESTDVVLEIGPGLGALTSELGKKVSRVIAVEIDPLLIEPLRKNLPANVEVVHQDFMKFDLDQFKDPYTVVGNLPYYITTPILFKVLEHPGWVRSIFMVQKEVADRLFARPGTKDYGRLSVMIQAGAAIQKEFSVPPTVFYPQPSVESTVISMMRRSSLDIDMELFSEIVRLAFGQRRKKLRNTITNYLQNELMIKFGEMRPETLSVEDFVEISTCCNRT